MQCCNVIFYPRFREHGWDLEDSYVIGATFCPVYDEYENTAFFIPCFPDPN